jgi:uncharacterized protein YjlB
LDLEDLQGDHLLLINVIWSFLENIMNGTLAYRVSRQIEHQSGDCAALPAGAGSNRPASTLSGYCKLEAGHAQTLQARQAGVLRIMRGRVWLTFNNEGRSGHARTGDFFLSRGESLQLAAGEAVVMEPYGLGHAPSAYYSWEPATEARAKNESPPGRWLLRLAARALGGLARLSHPHQE